MRRLLVAAAALLCTPLFAATHTFSIYIDKDNLTATGCNVTVPGGTFSGADHELRTTVVTDTLTAHVDQVQLFACSSGSFSNPVLVDAGNWPVQLGSGDGGTALIETYVPLSLISSTGTARFEVVTAGDSIGPTVLVVPVDIPLTPGLLAALAIALSLIALIAIRRRALPIVGAITAIVLMAAVPIVSWTSDQKRATDPKGDVTPPSSDLVSFYSQIHARNFVIRIDADVRPDGPNFAPIVNAGTDQTITLPDNGAALSATVTDDGQPAPANLTLLWTQVTGPAGSFIASPTTASTNVGFGVSGTYVLRLTASDGSLSTSDDVTVTVNAETNGAPQIAAIADRTIALGESVDMLVVANDPNPTDTLTYSLPTAPAGAMMWPTGSPRFRFTPTAAQTGPLQITVRVQDQTGAFDTEDFTLTVVNGNEPPVLEEQLNQRIAIGSQFTRDLDATDPDLPADTLTFELLDGPAGMSLTGDDLQWTPDTDDRGDHLVTVKVKDLAGAHDQERFILTAVPFVAPVARNDTYETSLGATMVVSAAGLLGNDVDPEGGSLTASKLTDPDKGSITAFGADGSFTFAAPPSVAPPPPLDVQTKWLGFNPHTVLTGHSPLIGDLDGDGESEIVFSYPNNGFTALNHDGTELFSYSGAFPAPNGDCWAAGSQMAIGDVDDDGDVEIILGVTCTRDQFGGPAIAFANNRVAAISYSGQGIVVDWLSPSVSVLTDRGDGTFYSQSLANTQNVHFTIARLDPEEPPSVLWARTYNPATGPCSQIIAGKTDTHCRIVTAHDGSDGTISRRFYYGAEANVSYENWGEFYGFIGTTVPIVADLDDDDVVEIIADGTVWSLDGDVVHAFDGTASQAQTALDSIVVDLDLDGSPEIITAPLYNTFGSLGQMNAYHADGTLMWRLAIPRSTVQSRMTAADLDRDGRPEILFSIYSHLYAITADGRYKWARTFEHGGVPYINPGGGHSSRFAVYDLNGDGVVEVIVQDGRNDVLFLRGDTGATQTNWHYSDPVNQSEPTSSTQVQTAPTVADLDGDGHAEVVVMHDINLNGTYAVVALEGVHDWRAAPRWFSQRVHMGSNVEDDGGIPATPPDYWTSAATNVFGQQPPEPYDTDPRERTETTFTYKASNAALDSDPATVTIGILAENRPPVVTSTPPATAGNQDYRFTPPGPLTYQIAAVDPDVGDTLSYTLAYRGCGEANRVSVSSAGLFSYFDGNPGNEHLCIFAVDITDNHGAVTQHAFSIFFTSQSRTVPNLIGDDHLTAPFQLSQVELILGHVVETTNAAPAGQIIGQSPAGGQSVPRRSAVDLIVSSGPAPAVVPDVVGRQLSSASSLLTSAGFSTGSTTFFYNANVPRGEVLSQSPVAGSEVIPVPVNLTISAGSGLEIRLARSVTTTDVPITFSVVSFSLAGVEGPPPALSYAVTPLATPFAGSLPTISANSIVFTSTTRGGFRLTATDTGTGRSAFADFAVAAPRASGSSSQAEQFALLTETLNDMQTLLRQAKAAVDANDTTTATNKLSDFVLRWRAFDKTNLRIAAPFSPDNGFPPQVGDLPGSVMPGPDDFINEQLLAESSEALKAWNAGLRAETTTLNELQQLADAFIVKAHLLRGLTPGEYGTVLAAPRYAAIATRRIPDLMDALTNELAPVVGLPASTTQSNGRRVSVSTTLSEVIVSTAVSFILDQVNEMQVYVKQILHQAFYGAAVAAVTQHVKSFVQGKELDAVIAGASASFQVFESQNSMIEGRGLDYRDPDVNTVIMIGPQLFDAVFGLVDKIKGASKLNVDPDEPGGEPRYKNLEEIYNGFAELISAGEAVGEAFDNAQQPTDLALRPCIFTSDGTCVQLYYPDGFKSVYEYAPPAGLSQLTGLPLPIVFMVKNNCTGQILFGTPIFFPTPPDP